MINRLPLYWPERPSEKQWAFLQSESIETLYGGAAGGGKTSALLMAALQYVDIPGYNAIIFRRTFIDLFLPGAIGDRFYFFVGEHNRQAELDSEKIKWDNRTYTATFPSGARLSFGYLDSAEDYKRYKASNFQFIGIDQVEEVRGRDYHYLLSRLRRPSSGPASLVPLRMRATGNPSEGWVRQRFMERTFVPARHSDNPGIDHGAYTASFALLEPKLRQQLEDGCWWPCDY